MMISVNGYTLRLPSLQEFKCVSNTDPSTLRIRTDQVGLASP